MRCGCDSIDRDIDWLGRGTFWFVDDQQFARGLGTLDVWSVVRRMRPGPTVAGGLPQLLAGTAWTTRDLSCQHAAGR